jgi:hypothetical protein
MIPLTTLYQTEFVTIEVNTALSFIQISWLQQPSSDLFRKETTLLTDYALSNNYSNALFDIRNRNYLDMADQNWLVGEIFPRLKGRHIRLAYLVSTAGLEIMDIFRVHDRVVNNPDLEKNLEIDIFLDKEDALKWLLESKVSRD